MDERRNRKKRNPLVGLFILIVIIGVIGFFGYKIYLKVEGGPVGFADSTEIFTVSEGESVDQIAKNLEAKGLINSAFVFKVIYKAQVNPSSIGAGNYQLARSMSSEQILSILEEGSNNGKVTLLEGWRNEEMAEKLNQQLGINKSDFIKLAKEGYMFPDTYDFAPNATAADVVKVLKDNFDKKYTASLQQKIQAKGFNSVQGVILASLVEREARSDEVRKNVASIMLKRLEVGMPLNIDATVQYALGYQAAEKNWWKKSLTYDDLKINSPYNTYLYQGLPPGPICNPSLSSLNAVANADTSIPYLYYFHDLQGNTYYAKTLEEHEANVAKHR